MHLNWQNKDSKSILLGMWTVDTPCNTQICLSLCLTSVLHKNFFFLEVSYMCQPISYLQWLFRYKDIFIFILVCLALLFQRKNLFVITWKNSSVYHLVKIFGVIRMTQILTLPGSNLILTCSMLQSERQTDLGIFGISDCFFL